MNWATVRWPRTARPTSRSFAEFGREIVDGDGRIDRQHLAALVFDHPDKLARLNAIVHPAVHRLQESIEREFRAATRRA